jgi:hypothetical protein
LSTNTSQKIFPLPEVINTSWIIYNNLSIQANNQFQFKNHITIIQKIGGKIREVLFETRRKIKIDIFVSQFTKFVNFLT